MNGEEKNVVRGVDVKEPADVVGRGEIEEAVRLEEHRELHRVEYRKISVVTDTGSYEEIKRRVYSTNPILVRSFRYTGYGVWEEDLQEIDEKEYLEITLANREVSFFDFVWQIGFTHAERKYKKILLVVHEDNETIVYESATIDEDERKGILKIEIARHHLMTFVDAFQSLGRKFVRAYIKKKVRK